MKAFLDKVLYPVIVAGILGVGATLLSTGAVLLNMWMTQKVILEKIENIQQDTNQVVKWLDEHEREGH